MKHIKIYAYSNDQALMDWLSFLVEKEDADIIICSTEQELNDLYTKSIPDILLLDDNNREEEKHQIIKLIGAFMPQKKKRTSMIVVLSAHASDLEYRVDVLLKGADYIIEKPVNMIELIARINAMVRHQKYVQECIHKHIIQTRDIATFDTMDKIMLYLNDHIKPHIEAQIAMVDSYDSSKPLEEDYLSKLKNDGLEILALLHTIREDIHEFISVKNNKAQDFNHFEQLFKKNIELIHMAYDDYAQERKDSKEK